MRFSFALLGILLLSLSLSAAPAVTLDSPTEGSFVQPPVYLQFSYDADGTGPSTVSCAGYLAGLQVTQAVIVPDGGSTVAAYPKYPGVNDIKVRCDGTNFHQEILRSFTIDPDSMLETKVTAFNPGNGFVAESGNPVDFTFIYEKGDSFVESPNCYLEFFANPYNGMAIFAGMASVSSGDYSAISAEVPFEAASWVIDCYDPSDQDPHFPINSELRNISVALPGYAMLEFPEEGYEFPDGNWPQGIFAYSYVSNGGPREVSCSLSIDGRVQDTRNAVSETSNLVYLDLSGFQQGAHQWQVSCANNALRSESRPFVIRPDFLDAWSVTLHRPHQFEIINFPYNASFTYNRGKDTAPYSVWCHVEVNGEQNGNSYGAISGVPTEIPLRNFYGNAALGVVCNYNGFSVSSQQVSVFGNDTILPPPPVITPPPGFVGAGNGGGIPGLMGSGGGSFLPRPLARTTTSSLQAALDVANTSNPGAQRAIEIESAVLTAPAEGTVGEQVFFTLKSSAGKPLSAIDVFIRVPNSTLSLKAVTDSQGKASFVPRAAGLYSYRAAGYSLSGNPTTLVVEKKSGAENASGFGLGEIGNWILLIIALLLVIVILYSAYKIIAGKPEQPQEPMAP